MASRYGVLAATEDGKGDNFISWCYPCEMQCGLAGEFTVYRAVPAFSFVEMRGQWPMPTVCIS